MKLEDVIFEMQSLSTARHIDNHARQKCGDAAEIIQLIAWAEEVKLEPRPFGSGWIATSGALEGACVTATTLLGVIKAAKGES